MKFQQLSKEIFNLQEEIQKIEKFSTKIDLNYDYRENPFLGVSPANIN